MRDIAEAFEKAGDRALLVPYLTAGWPSIDATPGLLGALESAGADLIEIGVPFSDPSADGPVVQRANEEALANGSGLATALSATRAYRDAGGKLPVVLMGYANPFLRYGVEQLAADCASHGVNGILAVDWPPAPKDGLGEQLEKSEVDRIVLIAPTTSLSRASEIGKAASGYVYYVSMQGVTGKGIQDTKAVARAGKDLRSATGLPVAVGFGIRTPQDCAALGASFDAVVVGSRLLEEIRTSENDAANAAIRLLAPMREALT